MARQGFVIRGMQAEKSNHVTALANDLVKAVVVAVLALTRALRARGHRA